MEPIIEAIKRAMAEPGFDRFAPPLESQLVDNPKKTIF